MSQRSAVRARRTPAGPVTVATERRTHQRLRELCDEVLASYRLASGAELFTDTDREQAKQLLTQIAPGTHASVQRRV